MELCQGGGSLTRLAEKEDPTNFYIEYEASAALHKLIRTSIEPPIPARPQTDEPFEI